MISIWEKESFFAPQDVLIAGSGLVGLWCALQIKKRQPDARITVLERGVIPTGASTRNAGFACFGSLSELVADEKAMGTKKMLQLVDLRFRGLEMIRSHFSDAAIDFQPCGGYELFSPETSLVALQHDLLRINELLRPVTGQTHNFSTADDQLDRFGFGATGHLVFNPLEGALHSGKLVQGLMARVAALGVTVLNGCTLREWAHTGSGIQVTTDGPYTFTGRRLLICTNAFVRDLLPQTDVVPARGQVVVTSPLPGLPWAGTFHAEEGYYYFRNLGNRVLLGGARHTAFAAETTTDMNTSEGIQQTLEQYLDEVILPRYKGQYAIEHRWSGIMAMGSEKMPVVGQVAPDVFCAVRMSGMGVALAPVVAEQVAGMMDDETVSGDR